jgi:hypothetical protein
MNRVVLLAGLAVGLSSQSAIAQYRMTAPLKIARECKSELELYCKAVRPGGRRVIRCLQEKERELSPACLTALKSSK